MDLPTAGSGAGGALAADEAEGGRWRAPAVLHPVGVAHAGAVGGAVGGAGQRLVGVEAGAVSRGATPLVAGPEEAAADARVVVVDRAVLSA